MPPAVTDGPCGAGGRRGDRIEAMGQGDPAKSEDREAEDRDDRDGETGGSHQAAFTVIVSIELRMKPPGFQTGSKPCASPAALVQRTASL